MATNNSKIALQAMKRKDEDTEKSSTISTPPECVEDRSCTSSQGMYFFIEYFNLSILLITIKIEN